MKMETKWNVGFGFVAGGSIVSGLCVAGGLAAAPVIFIPLMGLALWNLALTRTDPDKTPEAVEQDKKGRADCAEKAPVPRSLPRRPSAANAEPKVPAELSDKLTEKLDTKLRELRAASRE
jgi:hypothetical protein